MGPVGIKLLGAMTPFDTEPSDEPIDVTTKPSLVLSVLGSPSIGSISVVLSQAMPIIKNNAIAAMFNHVFGLLVPMVLIKCSLKKFCYSARKDI